jgi:CubicO group peptidase (beta-lactamase class C family)
VKRLVIVISAAVLTVMANTLLLGCATSRTVSPSSRVDQVFAEWNTSDSPGCSLAISRNGTTLYEHAYGMANLELGVRLTPASVLSVASISKQFTAMRILLLAERA